MEKPLTPKKYKAVGIIVVLGIFTCIYFAVTNYKNSPEKSYALGGMIIGSSYIKGHFVSQAFELLIYLQKRLTFRLYFERG